jgi:hypothetical protein
MSVWEKFSETIIELFLRGGQHWFFEIFQKAWTEEGYLWNSLKKNPGNQGFFLWFLVLFFGKFWKTGSTRGCNKIKEPPNTVW